VNFYSIQSGFLVFVFVALAFELRALVFARQALYHLNHSTSTKILSLSLSLYLPSGQGEQCILWV
jgi:hypothetical protein